MKLAFGSESSVKFAVIIFALISVTGCSRTPSSAEQSSKSSESVQTATTVFVDSPYFSGSLKLTDQEGWIYQVDVPNLVDLDCSLQKTVIDSPPGKANVEAHFNFGNSNEIKITPNTPGRNAPLVGIRWWYLVRLPVSLKNEQGQIPVISSSRVMDYLGRNNGGSEFVGLTQLTHTDFNLTTDDADVPLSSLYLSGLKCDFPGVEFYDGPYFEKNKEEDESEQAVDYLISIFQEPPVLVIELDNGCNISFTKYGEVSSPISERRTELSQDLKTYWTNFPALWSGENSCKIE